MFVLDQDDVKVYAYKMVENPATTATEFGQHDSSLDVTITANNDKAEGLWGSADQFWAAEDDFSPFNLVFAYDRPGGAMNRSVNFGGDVINGNGIRNPRGLHSDGKTMFVMDAEDAKVYALKMSGQTWDSDRDIALDPDNTDAEGLWYGNGLLWVADAVDDKLYAYPLSSTADTGLTVYNFPPTGLPAITGTVQVEQTLTAVVSGITDDVNGVPESVVYTYQWISGSDASTYTDIDGATASTYTLVAADQGKKIKVEASFTDAAGFNDTVTSDATGVVAAKASDPSGDYIWAADLTVGTATSGSLGYSSDDAVFTDDNLSDTDFDIRSTTYTVSAISQRTLESTNSMMITVSPVLPDTVVSALALDVAGLEYSLSACAPSPDQTTNMINFTCTISAITFTADDAVLLSLKSVNTPAEGQPTIGATAQVGQALTADTAGITDVNDIPDDVTYQWSSSRGSRTYAVIEGAEAASYTPVAADLNRNIRVKVSFTDGAGFPEAVTSDATGRVSPAALAAIGLATANGNPSGVWGNETTIWVSQDVAPGGNKIFAYNVEDGSSDSAKDFDTLEAATNTNPRGLWSDGVTMYVLDREDCKLYAYTMVEDPATTVTEFGQRDSSKDFTLTANNNRVQGLWGKPTTSGRRRTTSVRLT